MNSGIPALCLLASVCPLLAGSPRDLLGEVIKSDAIKQFCAGHELKPESRNVKETYIPLKDKEGTRVMWVETVRLKETKRDVCYVLTRQGFWEGNPLEAPVKPLDAPFRVAFAEINHRAVVDLFPKSWELSWNSRADDVYKVLGRGEYDFTDESKSRHLQYFAGAPAGGPPYQFSFAADGSMSQVIIYSTK